MKYSMLLAALLGALGLSACDRPTVVNNPPVATVPGPPGPQGEPGRTGTPGPTGDTNVTVTTPPAPPATAASETK
jgi:hypothetical protein